MPDMAIPALRRLEKCLVGNCTCGGDQGQLVRREIHPEGRPSYWTVWLQCLTCGRGFDGPLSVGAHFKWQSYAEWNPLLREAWEADSLARFTAATEQQRLAAAEARKTRSEEYDWFLRTDPRWRALALRVRRRANGLCEACLDAPVEVVHHDTYAYGLLPPAKYLTASCRPCHGRFHTEGDEWSPRNVNRPPPDAAQ